MTFNPSLRWGIFFVDYIAVYANMKLNKDERGAVVIMLESTKYIATPPGATIKEQLNDRGMTQKEFANRMGMSKKRASKLLSGCVHLTPDTAERLELVLGIPAGFWNKLEAIYQEKSSSRKW